jgi:hypothetical protein
MNVHGPTCQDGTIISSSLEFTNAMCQKLPSKDTLPAHHGQLDGENNKVSCSRDRLKKNQSFAEEEKSAGQNKKL